jgi:hypothetical protein
MLFINAETILFKINGIIVKTQKTLYFFYRILIIIDVCIYLLDNILNTCCFYIFVKK